MALLLESRAQTDRYQVFITNLLSKSVADKRNVNFPHLPPSPYRCPEERSSCEEGYSGPLCSVCTKGHYKQAHQCKKCPSAAWIAKQFVIVAITISLIIAFCVSTSKKERVQQMAGMSLYQPCFYPESKLLLDFIR